MDQRIFISHSSKDSEIATTICNALESNGMKCWIAPRDIPYGMEWAGEISKAIANSCAFLFLSSGNSNSSSQVSREIQLAIENQVPIIPIKLDGTEYSDTNKYYLATIHCMFQYDASMIAKLVNDISKAIPENNEDETVKKTKKEKKVTKKSNPKLKLILCSAWLWICTVVAAYVLFFSDCGIAASVITIIAAAAAGFVPLLLIRHKSIKSFMINKKTANIISAIALIITIGLSVGMAALDNYLWTTDLEYKYRITLTAPENMSVSEFKTAYEIIESRMDILADGQKYKIKNNGDEIELIVPFELFGELTATDMHKCYISRAAKIYLTTNNIVNFTADPTVVEVTPEDIESIQILKGKIPGEPEVTEKHVLDPENYEYIEVVLRQDFIKANKTTIDGFADKIVFAQDKVEIPDGYYYYETFKGEKEGVFYLLNDDRLPTLNELLINNMTTEHPAKSLLVTIDGAADWENSAEGTVFGELQKNYQEIKGDTVCISYRGSTSDSTTEGEWHDTVSSLKKRLDAFNEPYALGYGINDPYLIVVKISPEKLNTDILSLICSSGLTMQAGYAKKSVPVTYNGEKCVELADKDGVSALRITPPDNNEKKLFENLYNTAKNTENDNIYLVCKSTEMTVLSAKAESPESFVFTCPEGQEADSSRLPALALAIYENKTAVRLSLETYSFSDHDMEFDDNVLISEETRSAIEQKYPVKFIAVEGGNLKISFDFTIDEKLPQNIINASKDIYNLVDFENSMFSTVSLYFISEQGDERCRVFFDKHIEEIFSADDTDVGYPYIHGIFRGGRIERDHQTFLDLIAEDEFFCELNHYDERFLFFD